ncbi:MAG: hypothetical protein L3J71_14490 [Victivallaceae bacterium]|nr:hypothetical protein [Victivallaceae bacterium]
MWGRPPGGEQKYCIEGQLILFNKDVTCIMMEFYLDFFFAFRFLGGSQNHKKATMANIHRPPGRYIPMMMQIINQTKISKILDILIMITI